ncbi:hypothetical protein K439DRAFT_1327342, partial [Ramaria rubella]
EVGPSLTHVGQSCLMTLNNLLSHDADEWQPIVPSRRHSMPVQSPTKPSASFQALLPIPTSSLALHTLVSNLRHRYDSEVHDMEASDDASLLRELDKRVTSLIDNGTIQSRDAPLARSLVSLITHLNRVSVIFPDSSHRSPVELPQPPSTADIYDTLRRQVSELQSHRDARALVDPEQESNGPPIQVVENAILWNKIDDDLDQVFRLCRERAESVPQPYSPTASLPPEYDLGDYEPPTYDPTEYSEAAAAKAAIKPYGTTSLLAPSQSANAMDEKMRLDLEAVTMAIDRLYLVAPQLTNQRVELKRSKLEQMERARAAGSDISPEKKGEKDVQELERMLELIGKASTRRIEGQSVVLDEEGGMAARVEKARLRDLAKRDAFHERLVSHSGARRLTSQDAILHKSASSTSLGTKTRNPDALLTLPEFIREAIPDTVEQARDPEALLTLPEFVLEAPPPPSTSEPATNLVLTSGSKFLKKPFKPSRSRSLSAPPLALARLISNSTSNFRTPSPLAESKANATGLSVQYVAEHQENLGSVAMFLQVNGTQAGVDVAAEVVPSGGDRLIVKCGASTSAPLALPARVLPGKKEVKVQSGHLEVKLDCISGQLNGHGSFTHTNDSPGTGLLDATQLKILSPTSFICASCSLPLVQSSKLSRYDDLPSEHWAELLEAWMCHADQKLTDKVSLYANGLWPAAGQALVGGSYVLFESSSIVVSNIRAGDQSKSSDDWQPVRCICGAITGRCREHPSSEGISSTTYRLAKYAIRPVSPCSDPMKIPLSAFILQDMDEFVQAHATYRFVLLDEEDEKPRILIWMFKPNLRISYAASDHYFMARSASIQAAKVHFKILGPSVSPTLKSTVEKYPGFGQSERLLYPLDICRRVAGLLKESNTAYPQGRRVMGGLDVGWLLRV